MAGIVPGFPDLETSFEVAKTIIESGADILELSASFSDPVADGPTLQQAHAHVLKQGITKEQVFQLYKKIRSVFSDTPLFVIEYANCVYRPGINEYYRQLSESGVDSLLIPDLSFEESAPFLEAANAHKISQIFIIAPTTPNERILKLDKASSVFLYLVTITGVTGQREQFLQETTDFIKRVKQTTPLPLIAGFGISKPEHVKQAISAGADGVVSCSAIINLIKENKTNKMEIQKQLQYYIKDMKNATLLRSM
ncbi:tryptophan synthase subunit alpha [Candidatus Parcubacteria bacterium]|nr:tryptophan synthase subunit alpha [Candidatus Parcubacteria bacterium]